MNGWELAWHSIPDLLVGLVTGTIPLTILSFIFGIILALLTAMARLSSIRVLRGIAAVYVSVIRGTPLLVQLFIIFYAMPSLGITINPFPSAVIAFSLNVGGYASEIIRAAILAVPTGQWEAAKTVNLNYVQTMRLVILPQAFRVAVPGLSNTFISLVKDTSLASTILVTELLRKAQEIAAPTFQFLQLYTTAALIYWVVCQILSFGQTRLEKRLSHYVLK